MTRRGWLGLAAAAVGSSYLPAHAATGVAPDGLGARAKARGIVYGSCVDSEPLRTDASFADAILRECALVVPGFETKWGITEPKRGARSYARSDFVLDFALRNGLAVRGHTAIWYINVPRWVEAAVRAEGQDVLDERVRSLLTYYKGRIADWDVVNEAIEPRNGKPGGLRDSVFYRALGPGYIARCFRVARETDPAARLVYNDYGMEYPIPGEEARRRAMIELCASLKRDGLLDGIGLQAHVTASRPFDQKVYRAFLTELAAFGVPILLTEFDVSDVGLPAPLPARDLAVADYARKFLDAALDEKAVRSVISWGLSDKYTWLNLPDWARKDGERNRALPLDESMNRKPLWEAMARSFDGAPDRRSA